VKLTSIIITAEESEEGGETMIRNDETFEIPKDAGKLTDLAKAQIEERYPIFYKAIIHHLEEASTCYFHLQMIMLTLTRANEAFSEIDNALTWDVIDEAKAHFKSALERMKADVKMAHLKRQGVSHTVK